MELGKLTNALETAGIPGELVSTIKNGVTCTGIRIPADDGGTGTIVYYSDTDTVEAVLDRIRGVKSTPVIIPEEVTTWEYVREHVYLAVQKPSEEDILKTDYLNLEVYMRVYLRMGDWLEDGTYKVTPQLAEVMGIEELEIWNAAMRNSRKCVAVYGMSSMIGLPDSEDTMFISTYDGEPGYGAAAICFPEIFRRFCQEHDEEECYILPSSTMEMIVLPGTAVKCFGGDLEDLVGIVSTVNSTEVDPVLQLTPAVFRYSLMTDEVTVAAKEV